MKKTLLAMLGMGLVMGANSVHANIPQPDIYQQSYALYTLYHPANKDQSTAAITQQLSADFASLFKANKKVTEAQFIAFEQQRLEPLLKQRREMSLKQTYVRFGILDANKDQKMTLKEFQASGMKTFDELDKNQDGTISDVEVKLFGSNTATHDGFKVRLPISMPMANTPTEFIQTYGQGKAYTTLGDYLSARDNQFIQTDSNKDTVITEQEYVDEFMQRFDANSVTGKEKMKQLAAEQFKTIAKGKSYIESRDIADFAKKIDQALGQ